MQVVRFRIRPLLVPVLACAALAVPAVAEAAKLPEHYEGVTVKRYLMGRVKPTQEARGAAHLWTNTGFSNRRAVYPVLAHKVFDDGTEWLRVRALRNRTQVNVWIPRWATHRVWVDYRIKVDISSRRATIYRKGKVVKRYRVVVGAPNTPTPTGRYYVVDRMHLHNSWANGQWALATSGFSRILKHFDGGQGQVALHARGFLRDRVGTAASHGCVRFNDHDMSWLAKHVPNGTTIQIQK
jgi:hypothetical protein